MYPQLLKVLLIEDNPGDANLIKDILDHGHETVVQLETADRLSMGLSLLTRGGVDGVLLDLSLPDSQGLDTLRTVQGHAAQVPIIILSGLDDQSIAQKAVREGAQDYLVKGCFDSEHLLRSLHYAVERKRAEEALRQSEQRYKKLLEAVTDYVYTVQVENGRAITTVHGEGCAAVTGYSPQEFALDPFLWYHMIHEDDRVVVMEQTSLILSGYDTPPIEHRIYHKSGVLRWIRNTMVSRRDNQEHLLSYEGLISNVTERKRVEEALRASEERYRLLFERNQAGILISNLAGTILDCNESFARILGYESLAEVKSHLASEFYWNATERNTLLLHLSEYPTVSDREICLRRKQGDPVWVLATISLISEKDNPTQLHTTIIDITERKRGMEALKDSEVLYHSLVESLPLLMFRKNLQGQFTFANKRFCDSLGTSLAEVVGKTDFDFYPIEFAQKYQKDDVRVLGSGLVFEDTEYHQKPSGDSAYVAVVKTPVYDAQKRIIGIQGMFWDVTNTKWVEEQKAQLRIAQAIQQKLLPRTPPQIPGFDFGGISYPAEECSGDYFDYIVTGKSVDLVLGDVSGHGFGPALLAAVTHSCLRTLALSRMDINIEAILSTVNRLLLEDTDSEHFVTLIFARIDFTARTLLFSNAGHPAGCLLDSTGTVKAHLSDTGPLLGVFPDGQFPTGSPLSLREGDLLLLVSDGVLEASPGNGKRFGMERTLEIIRAHRHKTAQFIVDALCKSVLAFHENTPQRDDITVIVVKVCQAPS